MGFRLKLNRFANSVAVFVRHTQIHDGQHHEDERLQRDNQNVEDSPWHRQCPLRPEGQQGDQDEDQLTSVQVTEQTQGERDRLGQQANAFQQQVDRNQQQLEEDELLQKFAYVFRYQGFVTIFQQLPQHLLQYQHLPHQKS